MTSEQHRNQNRKTRKADGLRPKALGKEENHLILDQDREAEACRDREAIANQLTPINQDPVDREVATAEDPIATFHVGQQHNRIQRRKKRILMMRRKERLL